MSDRPDPGRGPGGPTRWPYAVLAYLFVGLALIGVVLPGLPTFPFLLLAAWAASRGSERLHDWLYGHPRFGPSLVRWREERSISTRAKASAIALLVVSWLVMLAAGVPLRALVGLAGLFVAVALFLVTRPRPSDDGSGDGSDGRPGAGK